MTTSRRSVTRLILFAVLGIGLFDAWELWQWADNSQQLALDQQQLAAADHLANSIRALRRAPEQIEASARSADALAKLIESAAQQVGLATDRIVHVAPTEPRRIGNSDYLEQLTQIDLRGVSLKQLVDLTQAVGRVAPRLSIPAVTLQMPPGDPNASGRNELWNVQLTLTAHVYEPKIAASR